MQEDINILRELQAIEESFQREARERKYYGLSREWGKAATVTRHTLRGILRIRARAESGGSFHVGRGEPRE